MYQTSAIDNKFYCVKNCGVFAFCAETNLLTALYVLGIKSVAGAPRPRNLGVAGATKNKLKQV